MSEHYNSDPYALSLKVRKRFRDEKKVEKQKKSVDDQIKGRYGLTETLSLLDDNEETTEVAKQEWAKGRREQQLHESNKRQKLAVAVTTISSSVSSSLKPRHRGKQGLANPLSSLRARILENTAQQTNPFNGDRHQAPNFKAGIILRK
jgi:coiled-coil domain-containing protein 130